MNAKREHALQLLSRTGIWPSNYAPPALHLLWKMGLDLPPPHLARPARLVPFLGLLFGLIWGIGMWFILWRDIGMSVVIAVVSAVVAGLLFGAIMAGYYAYGRRRHQLPYWDELKVPG
jgi:hypothetical protein